MSEQLTNITLSSKIMNFFLSKMQSVFKWLLKQDNRPIEGFLLKYFYLDYFCASTLFIFLFILIKVIYLSRLNVYFRTCLEQLEMSLFTIILSNLIIFLTSKICIPHLVYLISFILPNNCLITKFCIILAALSFIYLSYSFLLPKYDRCTSLFSFFNILILLGLNVILYISYFTLLKNGILHRFTDGILSGTLLSLSPIINLGIQIALYLVIDLMMSLLEPFKSLVRERTLENKLTILKELEEKEKIKRKAFEV